MSMTIQGMSGPLSSAAAGGAARAPGVQRPGPEEQRRPQKPAMDEYGPEEKREPWGRYWLGRDEDGQPKVYFDDPERGHDADRPDDRPDAGPAQDKLADAPEKKAANGKRAEICRGSTDAVDREIEKLRKKKEELERRISSETDENKIKELEQKLAQVEGELRQKDNDTYRRQHTAFS